MSSKPQLFVTPGTLRFGQFGGATIYGGGPPHNPWPLFAQVQGNALQGFQVYAGPSSSGANITTYNGGAALLAPTVTMVESAVTPGFLVRAAGGVPGNNQGAHAYHDVPLLDPTKHDYTVSCIQSNNQSRLWLDFEAAGLGTDMRSYTLEIALDGARTLGLFDTTVSTTVPLAVTAANTLPAGLDTPAAGPPVYYTAAVKINHVTRTCDCYFNGVRYLTAVGLRAASASARWVGLGLQWLNSPNYADEWSGGLLRVTRP